jgi:hypothetical protein
MDDSRQRYFHRVFYFTGQDDYWRNGQIIRIDVILLEGLLNLCLNHL